VPKDKESFSDHAVPDKPACTVFIWMSVLPLE